MPIKNCSAYRWIMGGATLLGLAGYQGIQAEPQAGRTAATAPELRVQSNIVGLADTGNKSTLKKELIYTSGPGDINIYHYDSTGKRVVYEEQKKQKIKVDPVRYSGQALLSLGPDIDDSLIDSSEAKVSLLDGNSYYADEFILAANKLSGTWSHGQLSYKLKEGDIEWNQWGYDNSSDTNSGREWSMMGGDGNGVYYFRFQISGIKYAGKPVDPVIFPVAVYIYGRSAADLGMGAQYQPVTFDANFVSGLSPTNQVQWLWTSQNTDSLADGKPYLNDAKADYFSVVWPKGSDASNLSAEDVSITLYSKYGDSYKLSPKTAYGEQEYVLIPHEQETEVVVTYQQWMTVPVYSAMEISIKKGNLSASRRYAISSVGTYMVQTGGGGVSVDHTVTCFNYYGVKGMTQENAVNTGYTLSTELNGKTYFYALDPAGKPYLAEGVTQAGPFRGRVSAPAQAWVGDATEKYHLAVRGNVVFSESRTQNTQERSIDGVVYKFRENVKPTRDVSEMLAGGAYLEDGFNVQRGPGGKWAWTMRYGDAPGGGVSL